ncbi:MAG: DNA polymerase III subunit tau [Parcubacteria group bacterium ADurb.Bin305]|jgi:DNA polymerase-3 subunit gamma/tau|nr:DNA polymerase III subunit gamma/tau [Candidatus Paceibacterota bacterium]OQA44103.1 MAG: DNA polymerase III subunit tau [Parcubacteria group bacterium ADurb.Bin305]
MVQLVLYRKYRPQTFSEVINQKNTILALTNALKNGRISHAYLFAGPRGTGKTSVARILAKALNCLNRKPDQFEPCNQCDHCVEINEGRFLDLVEIDAASTRGIDDVRELRENIKFPPLKAKYKVFIIDEAHQLTKDAFNALLKTLEEPPQYVIFILATTEPEKLPPTVLSRLQRYDFRKLALQDIIDRLAYICHQENISYEEEALRLVAVYSEGGLRDAESLLGQIALITNNNITKESIEELMGVMNFEKVKRFINLLLHKDKEKALSFINEIYEEGADLELFNKEVINYLRKLMLLKISPSLSHILDRETTDEEMAVLFKQIEMCDLSYLERLLRGLIEVQFQLKKAPVITLPLELFISEELG